MTTPSITVTYLFDPLCGWCYAAAPALKYLQGVEGIRVALSPTGLFAGAGARPMDAQFAAYAYAWANDQRIQQLTGQPFTQAYRDRILGAANGRFDSGPATLALTAVAQTAPERELDALHALQHARYVEGRDNADAAVIADVLCSLGLQAAAAVLHEPHDALRAALLERVAAARVTMQLLGAQGVLQLAVAGQGGASQLVRGDALLGPREGLLARVQTAAA
ncbi:protein-disulfide isomerase [Acidovorax temperans]|uniref:Protein-disulfide isomerase n=1 Tax=Acidovorax temperans TaxID=80878 RepID=A0A0D7K574_9BURK|nr:DsbA family protein [Acidovorax temperans]KJA09496.1 protein-disulfide isomerase [Acidovorax temperans]